MAKEIIEDKQATVGAAITGQNLGKTRSATGITTIAILEAGRQETLEHITKARAEATAQEATEEGTLEVAPIMVLAEEITKVERTKRRKKRIKTIRRRSQRRSFRHLSRKKRRRRRPLYRKPTATALHSMQPTITSPIITLMGHSKNF